MRLESGTAEALQILVLEFTDWPAERVTLHEEDMYTSVTLEGQRCGLRLELDFHEWRFWVAFSQPGAEDVALESLRSVHDKFPKTLRLVKKSVNYHDQERTLTAASAILSTLSMEASQVCPEAKTLDELIECCLR